MGKFKAVLPRGASGNPLSGERFQKTYARQLPADGFEDYNSANHYFYKIEPALVPWRPRRELVPDPATA
jgi:hypothetical protein